MTDTTQGKRGYQERSLYHRVRYARLEQKMWEVYRRFIPQNCKYVDFGE